MVKDSEHEKDSHLNIGQSFSNMNQFDLDDKSNNTESKIFSKKCKKKAKIRNMIGKTIKTILCLAIIINVLTTGVIILQNKSRDLRTDYGSINNNLAIITEGFMRFQKYTHDKIEYLNEKQYFLGVLSKNATLNQAIPIGFIYTQLPFQSEPSVLWNWAVWEEISSKYSGHFFRVRGGSSAPFGIPQTDSVQAHSVFAASSDKYITLFNEIKVPEFTSKIGRNILRMSIETRPINYAVKIWQRIG